MLRGGRSLSVSDVVPRKRTRCADKANFNSAWTSGALNPTGRRTVVPTRTTPVLTARPSIATLGAASSGSPLRRDPAPAPLTALAAVRASASLVPTRPSRVDFNTVAQRSLDTTRASCGSSRHTRLNWCQQEPFREGL